MTTQDSPPVARLTDVSLMYGKTRALDGITLDIPAGYMVGLIGPDGVGKSSLMALVAGARRIQEGRVEVLGGDMADAARFDHLVAMFAGKVVGTGTPAELPARTGTRSLEEAFIALLPEEMRSGHKKLVVPPRPPGDEEVIIEAHDLTQQFGDFVAVDHVSMQIERGEIFGFLGANGCGKS